MHKNTLEYANDSTFSGQGLNPPNPNPLGTPNLKINYTYDYECTPSRSENPGYAYVYNKHLRKYANEDHITSK